MEDISDVVNCIKDSILQHVPAKYIYFFGSHVYGEPHAKSDIDIFLVVPDDCMSLFQLHGNIMYDLYGKDINYVDLHIDRISKFDYRKKRSRFEGNVIDKGRLIYESV